MGERIKKTISLSVDTADRLKQHAKLQHTSVSQLVTFWTWEKDLPSRDIKPYQDKRKNSQE